MTIVRFNIGVEAKKAAAGRKTKCDPEVLLRILAEHYLKPKQA